METAGEGGPYGMALLAAYRLWREPEESLADYLDRRVFAGARCVTVSASPEDAAGFAAFLETYRRAFPLEKLATEVL